MADTHIIAYVYHWQRSEIYKLTRTERKKWVELIKRQKEEEKKSANKST